MRFSLIDTVLEVGADDAGRACRAVALKHVTAAEEYLADHFPGFPILPGVFMLEALVHTARHVAEARDGALGVPWVLGSARAVKYGQMVPPGSTLRLEVELVGEKDGVLDFRGVGVLVERCPGGCGAEGAEGEPGNAVSGRFTLRRVVVE